MPEECMSAVRVILMNSCAMRKENDINEEDAKRAVTIQE